MRKLLATIVLLCASSAWAWPSNVVTVSNTVTTGACTTGLEWGGCNGAGDATMLTGLDGADIADGLQTCKAAHGCILRIPAGTYRNVAIDLNGYTTNKTAGRNGGSFVAADFSNGLIIDCLPGAKLQSEYLRSGFSPALDISTGLYGMFDYQPEIFTGTSGLWIRGCELDGRSEYLPAPNNAASPLSGLAIENQVADAQEHAGIRAYSASAAIDSGSVWITNNWVHSFMGLGIRVERSNQGAVFQNTVDHIGCWHDYSAAIVCDQAGSPFTSVPDTCGITGSTGCRPVCTALHTGAATDALWKTNNASGEVVAGEIPCGKSSGQTASFGWDLFNEQNALTSASPGFKVPAFGIMLAGRGKLVAVGNTTSYISKYANASASVSQNSAESAGAFDGNSLTKGPKGLIIYRGNTVAHSTVGFMCGTFCEDTIFYGNTVSSAGINGNNVQSITAFQTQGGTRSVVWDSNTVTTSQGAGLQDKGWLVDPAIVTGHVFKNNTVNASGLWADNDPIAFDLSGPIVRYTGLGGSCSPEAALGGSVAYQQFPMPFSLINNTVPAGSTSWYAVNLGHSEGSQGCPASKIDPLIITGGSYAPSAWAAHNTGLGQILGYNIVMSGVTLTSTGTAGVWNFNSGSTGTCATVTASGSNTVTNSGSVTGVSGGTCP
jgi:hypothetical protein